MQIPSYNLYQNSKLTRKLFGKILVNLEILVKNEIELEILFKKANLTKIPLQFWPLSCTTATGANSMFVNHCRKWNLGTSICNCNIFIYFFAAFGPMLTISIHQIKFGFKFVKVIITWLFPSTMLSKGVNKRRRFTRHRVRTVNLIFF